ncbi:uncharacterized protein LOC112692700 isoform X2 [Sipha flava]|uniref:Uncharacterized protein LOC112692700 isoform X2 n=1 Tax=Sipha flava TaxID=143950 RepID=A0A8B8GJ20_9HEMI|nr:uncharacterized protein LOC112692700 isoform X2 [Sipha flava]
MDSFKSNELVDISLIEWRTPEIVKNKTYEENCANNPFDILELKAATMDPFDLVPCQTPSKRDPPCGNILSPLFELTFKQMKRSVSLTDINGVAKILEKNCIDKNKDQINESQLKDNVTTCLKKEGCIQSIENVPVHEEVNQIETQVENNVLVLTEDSNDKDLEKNSVCNEEEKKLIREQTRQRISMLIEKGKQKYEVEYSRRSLFCTPQRNVESSLNRTENEFNRGFIHSYSDSFSFSGSKNLCDDVNANNVNNKSNSSSEIATNELNSFDLNSLKPEWIVDNFSDSDLEVHSDKSVAVDETTNTDDQVDVKLKALNRIGMVENQSNGCQTVLKSMQNKRVQAKGPFIANVPLQQMVQNYEDVEIKKIVPESDDNSKKLKPVAASTPTLDIVPCKTPTSFESSIKSSPSIRRSIASSIESPSTPLNVTKCIGKISKTNEKKLSLLNNSRLINSTNKRSNFIF